MRELFAHANTCSITQNQLNALSYIRAMMSPTHKICLDIFIEYILQQINGKWLDTFLNTC